MRDLDGSIAGGQFVRTALSFAALTGDPVRIEHVRGDRSTPGLRPQHLAVVETLAAICDAEVKGAEVGSETVTFRPDTTDPIPGGEYAVDVGTAGSLTLLFDALAPLAARLREPLTLTATGGTDVAWSPPADYYRRVKLPVCRRFGLRAHVEVDRRGFYPDGGGRATLHLDPSTLDPVDLPGRDVGAVGDEPGSAGPSARVRVYSTESASLADRDVASRQAAAALERLGGAFERRGDVECVARVERTVASDCPGSAVVVRVDRGDRHGGFSALGEPGKPAERVGREAADAAIDFLRNSAPVDRRLADQVLVFAALAGGRVRAPAATDHVEGLRALADRFGVTVECEGGPTYVVGPDEALLGER